MKKNILLIILFSVVCNSHTDAANSIQVLWMKYPYSFQVELQKSLEKINYKLVKQKNISKDFIERNMLRLELYVFLSGSSLYRSTEFGDMGNISHNPFEIELNINVSGTNLRGQKIHEHLILSCSDYTGKKTSIELYEDIIKDLISEIARIQNISKAESRSVAKIK
ncbi:MAG: hypothetical protein KC646_03080 [Candidatus Cloacimonetes bacterium]|nr:hypothetical protein [Candidatus Cloacimonadota bacterium]